MHTHIYKHARALTQRHARPCGHINANARSYMLIGTFLHACSIVRTQTHIVCPYTHTYTSSHTHTLTCTPRVRPHTQARPQAYLQSRTHLYLKHLITTRDLTDYNIIINGYRGIYSRDMHTHTCVCLNMNTRVDTQIWACTLNLMHTYILVIGRVHFFADTVYFSLFADAESKSCADADFSFLNELSMLNY